MTSSRRQQIEDLYRAAIRQPATDREQFLAEACGTDRDLRDEIDKLLNKDGLTIPMRDSDASAVADSPAAGLAAMEHRQLGPYKLEGLLGAGGMGKVYRATDTRLNRKVAVKLTNAHFQERFEREARAIAALNHPHICTLYDVGPNFLVMELLDGSTLADEMQKGPLAWEQIIRYGAQVSSALTEAHARGIVHRDLKPGNIMVTRNGLKVMDFGLARMASDATLTAANTVMGTPEYMSPEQMQGWEADERTDLFALGLVLYEMAAGKLPFPGRPLGRMLVDGSIVGAPRLSTVRADAPPPIDALAAKLLQRKPSERCQSSAEVSAVLSAEAERIGNAPITAAKGLLRAEVLVPAAILLALLLLAGVWVQQRAERRRWARAEAIPEIQKLITDAKPLAAFEILLKAEQYLPGDAQLAHVAQSFTRFSSVKSATPGAKVEIQNYFAPDEPWYTLGVTPLPHVRIPNGYFRWRLSQPGTAAFVSAPVTDESMEFPFKPAADLPAGMVPVPGGPWGDLVGFVGWLNYQLPAFDMDRFEVTNRDYQNFVDAGGYQKHGYWREKFFKDGKELTWEEAMEMFRDPTGRPGPSTWEAGHFPPGQSEYPVSGVSWYEASAYLAFVNKKLPALGQWYKTAPDSVAGYTINQSRFGGIGPLAVGRSRAVGIYGTYDLIGNVREWCVNTVAGDRRFILGGAWGTQTYQAYDPEALPPFDRSAFNGFRGVRNLEPLNPVVAGPIVRAARDFSKVKPATDQVFQLYRAMYAYDKRPLDAKVEEIMQDTADWTKQKITIDAGYDNERLPMYLFLPKHVRRPYQTVVFFPSARVDTMPSSEDLGDLDFVDYVIKSGRALLYPVYRVTYERHLEGQALPGEVGDRELTIQESKEVRRAVDYLETRPDLVDVDKLAYLGVSQGSAYGVIFTALEDRFKAVVFSGWRFFPRSCCAGKRSSRFRAAFEKANTHGKRQV